MGCILRYMRCWRLPRVVSTTMYPSAYPPNMSILVLTYTWLYPMMHTRVTAVYQIKQAVASTSTIVECSSCPELETEASLALLVPCMRTGCRMAGRGLGKSCE